MDGRQTATRKTFGNVAKFGDDFSADFPANSRGAKLLVRLDGVIARIDKTAPQQTTTGKLTKDQALNLLEDLMTGIAETARTVAAALKRPQLRADLHLTRGANEQEWLTDAQRILDRLDPQKHADATQITDEFIELEFPSDFIAKLGEYKLAVETAQSDQSGSVRTQTGATTSLTEDFAEGMSIAKELDTLCENRYGRNPQTKDARKLREWRQARHIEAPAEAHATSQTTTSTSPGA